MKKNQRKCKYCTEMIDLKKDEYLKIKTYYTHKSCYIEKQINRGKSNEEINVLLKNILMEMQEDKEKKIKKIEEENNIKMRNKKNIEQEKEFKNQFIKYLQENYNTNLTNRNFYVKLAKINNGTYKGLREGISYEDLLYMFKTKQKELNNIAFFKEKKGQSFKDSLARIYFDLAVIVNKYDSYKKWKQKQKILEAENINIFEENKNKIDFEQFNFNNINKKSNKKDIEIESIIDDI